MTIMLISHARRFVFFPDPLDGSLSISRGLEPLCDQKVLPTSEKSGASPFFFGMSPTEAEWAFDAMGLAFTSYMRIAVVENPYVRMVRLYNRIAESDPFWLARENVGLGRRDFGAWLATTRPDGYGAGGRQGPRWRRFGAWSAQHWCGQHINFAVRQEAIEEDMTLVLSSLGVAPAFGTNFNRAPLAKDWQRHYTTKSANLIAERYAWDLDQYGYEPVHMRRAV